MDELDEQRLGARVTANSMEMRGEVGDLRTGMRELRLELEDLKASMQAVCARLVLGLPFPPDDPALKKFLALPDGMKETERRLRVLIARHDKLQALKCPACGANVKDIRGVT